MDTDRVAVLVDMENVSAAFIEPLAELADTFGRVCHLAVYADWRQSGNRAAWGTTLDLGGVPKQIMKAGGANSADISIVVDAMELLLLSPEIDVFVIATGDSDFVPLIHKLRGRGKLVVGAAPAARTIRPEHEAAFDRFERLSAPGVDAGAKARAAAAPAGPASARPPTVLSVEATRKALTAILTREGAMTAGELGTLLRDAVPGFNQRGLGFRTLSDMLRAQSDLLSVQTDGNSLHVALRGTAATSESMAAGGAATKPAADKPPSLDRGEWARLRDYLLAVLLSPGARPHASDGDLRDAMDALAKKTEPGALPGARIADVVAHYSSCFVRASDGTAAPAIGLADAYKLRLGRVWEPLPRDVMRRGLIVLALSVGDAPVLLDDVTTQLAESGELTQAQARALVSLLRKADGWTFATPTVEGKPRVIVKPWVRDSAQAEAKLDEAAVARMGPFAPVDSAAMAAALGTGAAAT